MPEKQDTYQKDLSRVLRDNITDLIALMAVAEERSFTKAAARLNVSQSALSHTIKALEERLGLRLLTRTTRSVAPTIEGEDLIATLAPCLTTIEDRLIALTDSQGAPSGTVRIAATDYTIETLLWPKLAPALKANPEVKVEFVMDYGYTDLASAQCDAGVRYGEQVSDGMISMRIGPDERMVCVGSPDYFAQYGRPETPTDLDQHECINLRLSTHGALYAWEFEDEDGRELRIKVKGQACFDTVMPIHTACRDGHGLALLPELLVQADLKAGRLDICLGDYSPYFPGFHLYYPSRLRSSSAFQVVLDALRQRDK
ncbi:MULTISPECIES: LysR family transcriptional regulator [Cohaesibacter]|uniref:LysR family transcriptional regulator n=1 Tax=Cohaesibacter TaxID=655352 RepID=UPI000DEA9C2C|nr:MULTISPECIES: LysR family transcriptional regulator [Cohaesibacter]TLP44215.1 LysR family transcriptional regulator [Cohaesibacter sp. CAU 1516]